MRSRRRVAIAVAVGIGVESDRHALVGLAVAVIVEVVADFGGNGVASRAVVVAVGAVGNVTAGCRAGLRSRRRVAIAVAVGIGVESDRHALVGLAVAVVVEVVTDFGGSRIAGRAVVVAIVGARAARYKFGKQFSVGRASALSHGRCAVVVAVGI